MVQARARLFWISKDLIQADARNRPEISCEYSAAVDYWSKGVNFLIFFFFHY